MPVSNAFRISGPAGPFSGTLRWSWPARARMWRTITSITSASLLAKYR